MSDDPVSTTLSGLLVQTDCYRPVDRQSTCLPNEWACESDYGNVVCSSVNVSLCPIISSYSVQARFVNQSTTMPTNSTHVECTYTAINNDNTTFTEQEAHQWLRTFGPNSSWTDEIMPDFCSHPGNPATCPIDPMTGFQLRTCSRFTTTDTTGRLCRDYVKNSPNNATKTQEEFCKSTNTPDCLCLNRERNTQYQQISSQVDFDDESWYQPCRDPVHYVVTDDIANRANIATIPPCGEFNNVTEIRTGEINTRQYATTVDCDGVKDPQQFPVTGSSGSGRLLERHEHFIYAILIIIVIVIIIGFFTRISDTRRRNCLKARILTGYSQ